MNSVAATLAPASSTQDSARRFVEARRAATALPDYPGAPPADLVEAYARQEAAIGLWPDDIAGWKVGRIADALTAEFGAARLAGPIFRRNVWPVSDGASFPAIPGGFTAVEAEYVFRLDEDAPAGKTDWSFEEAAALGGELLIGVEIAGSPLPTINDLGPAVVVSDFGNNAGLFLGPAIRDWRARLESLTCETVIDGATVGRGGAASIPGSPLEAVRFLAENVARRGRPLKAGQLISTGAATGIHRIRAGQEAVVSFGEDGMIKCSAVTAAA